MGISMLGLTALLPSSWRKKVLVREPSSTFSMLPSEMVREQSLTFCMLPSEVLQHISDFLPVSSAVSFALCSRRVLWLLGDQALHCLRSADQAPEKEVFLNLLQRDLSDWLLCHYCNLFHPVAQDDGPETSWSYFDDPECVRASGVVYITMRYKLRYQQAQLLMNHYRFGRAYQIILERLCHKHTVTVGDTNIRTEIWGRIVVGELLVRVTSKLELLNPSDIDRVRSQIPEICNHQKGLDQRIFTCQTTLCRPCHAGRSPCVECSTRKSCQECSTWFQVSGGELGHPGTGIQIDIWRYLGSCEDPFDTKWRRQLDSICLIAPETSTPRGGRKASRIEELL